MEMSQTTIKVQISHCVESDQIRSYFWSVLCCIRTEYGFSPNTGKYGPETIPCLDTFHAVSVSQTIRSRNSPLPPYLEIPLTQP